MNRQRDTKDIKPPKFDIEKYYKSQTVDLSLWYRNIFKRVIVEVYFYSVNYIEVIEQVRSEISNNINTGFSVSKKPQDIKAIESNGLSEQGGISYRSIVVPATVRHLNYLYQDYVKYQENEGNLNDAELTDEFGFFASMGSPLSTAIINLQAPDDVLVEHFLMYLKEARKRRKIPEKKRLISDAKVRNWHESRVLPYIDLTHWHRVNELTITDGDAARLIFPDDSTGTALDKIRKTTKKHAREILSKDNIYSLQTQLV